MVESKSPHARQEMYSSGVASLIGGSGISLDGQSIQLPEETGFDVQDDISSINESSYYRGNGGNPQMKIVGTVASMEEGNAAMGATDMKTTGPEPADIQQALSAVIPLEKPGDRKKASPNMSNTSKILISGNPASVSTKGSGTGKAGCLPNWILAAPRWLKFVIVVSTAMLVGAVVLVTVALTSALAEQSDSTSNTSASEQLTSDFAGASSAPVMPNGPVFVSQPAVPTISPPSAPAPTAAVPDKKPSPTATDEPTVAPASNTEGPVPGTGEEPEQDTLQDEQTEAPEHQDPEAVPYDEFVTTFFVTGGRFTNDALAQVPEQLRTLPVRGGTSFMVHLGDWNSPYATQCDSQSYEDVNDLFSNSSIPVYFVPGDNDFNGKHIPYLCDV